MKEISRRGILGTAAAMMTTPAFAEECEVGPPQHHKGPLVFMDYDQLELDASYDQRYYEPLIADVSKRLSSNSDAFGSTRMPRASVAIRSVSLSVAIPRADTSAALHSSLIGRRILDFPSTR